MVDPSAPFRTSSPSPSTCSASSPKPSADRLITHVSDCSSCRRLLAGSVRSLLGQSASQSRLSHPNIVTVYDAGTFDEKLFIAMVDASPQTLRDPWDPSN